MDLSSFLTSLATSFAIFVVLMLLFTWLSTKPSNAVIYYPNRILKGLDPGYRTRNPFTWITEAISSTENDIVSMSGVDTAVYFVFLSTVLGILVLSGIVLLPALLPVSITDHTVLQNDTVFAINELVNLSMEHIREGSPRLWAYVVAFYWVSLVTYFLLWKAYKHVSELRATALMSPEIRVEQFVVLVRDIPSPAANETRKEQVDFYFKSIYPDTYYKSMVVTNNKEVKKIWEELEEYKKKLARAEAAYEKSKQMGISEGTRPINRIGLLGLCGTKVDTIEYYNEKINELIPKLEAEQKVTLRDKQLSAALIFFTSRVTAASVAQTLHARMVDSWTVMDAPEPCQLIWGNLSLNFYEREVRKYIVYIIVGLTILLYMIPIGFIAAFTTLKNLMKLLPFIEPVVKIASIRTILEAYLPQLALIIFLAILPNLLVFLSKVEGIPSESHVVRAASGKYFCFIVFNVFIGLTLGGIVMSIAYNLQNKTTGIILLLDESLPDNSTFFITYVALNFLVGYGLELSRIIPLIIYHIKRKYICQTEAELKETWAPGDFGYNTRVPNDMLIVTIVLCYSVIAPLIIPFGVVYFGLGWLVLRNQALKVYVPSYDSYGRMWPHMHTRILAALLLYQSTTLGYFGVKRFIYTPVLIPLPIISLIFDFVCRKKFYHFFQCTALEVASQELKKTPNMDQVFRSFIPPCLYSDNLDNDQSGDV